MFRSGHIEIDVIDNDDSVLLQWADDLAPLDYANFKYTDPADILPEYKHANYVGNFVYADVMGYNTVKFNKDTVPHTWADFWDRSEEHTSELQSLMRISYAVFCLKKKKIQ